jgi:hypothetical protein
MIGWFAVILPLAALPVVLLFVFVGCRFFPAGAKRKRISESSPLMGRPVITPVTLVIDAAATTMPSS